MVTQKIPDAWDDDWEIQADRDDEPQETTEPKAPLTRAGCIVRHQETSRKLWDAA